MCVTECDGWGGGGQRNREKCGRRLWMALSTSMLLYAYIFPWTPKFSRADVTNEKVLQGTL